MKKRAISLLVILCLLFVMLPRFTFSASAANYSGVCGSSVKWEFKPDTGTLRIYGSGEMNNYSHYGSPWAEHRKAITSLVIEEGVTQIGTNAFYEFIKLKEFSVASTVTHIGRYAFSRCMDLEEVYIPEGVKYISQFAFYQCEGLRKVVISDTVIDVGEDSFSSCINLVDVTIGENVTKIGRCAFYDCDSLTGIRIPDSVETIESLAFDSCRKLVCVVVGSGITEFKSSGIFASCPNLQYLFMLSGDCTLVEEVGVLGAKNLTTVYCYAGSTSEAYAKQYGYRYEWLCNCKASMGMCKAELVNPNCVSDGFVRISCQVCGSDKTVVLPAVGHKFDISTILQEENCTEDGLISYTCCVCGFEAEEKIPATGHSYDSGRVLTSPTCTNTGVKIYTCTICGYEKEEAIPAKGHKYNLTESVAPTCQWTGLNTYRCSTCGDVKQEIVPANSNHYYKLYANMGAYHVVKCTTCDASYEEAHSFVSGVCVCGQRENSVQPHTHQIGYVAAVPATCTEPGYTQGQYCTTCMTVLVEQKMISATGHHYVKDLCTQCGTMFPFKDVATNAWYRQAVEYVSTHQLMNGMGKDTYAPNKTLTRSMLVTILYRMAGSPTVEQKGIFVDVVKESWYADAIAWAYENNIAKGVSANRFAPDQAVSREQMVTFLYRYAVSAGLITSGDAKVELSVYKDATAVSGYATDGFRWAVGEGIVNGVSGSRLDPQGTATRAQVAQVIMKLHSMIHQD